MPRWTWTLAAVALVASPLAQAAGFWPYKDNRAKPGVTIHGDSQHQVKPLGNHLRVAKPLGSATKPPKTLGKRPS
jgi:hypothetical protein